MSNGFERRMQQEQIGGHGGRDKASWPDKKRLSAWHRRRPSSAKEGAKEEADRKAKEEA